MWKIFKRKKEEKKSDENIFIEKKEKEIKKSNNERIKKLKEQKQENKKIREKNKQVNKNNQKITDKKEEEKEDLKEKYQKINEINNQKYEERKKNKQKSNKEKKEYKDEENTFDLFGFKILDIKQGMQVKTKLIRVENDNYIMEIIDSFKEVYLPKNEILEKVQKEKEYEVLIYRHTNDDFYVSHKRLHQQKENDKLQEIKNNKTVLKGKIIKFEDPNYIVDLENNKQATLYLHNVSLNSNLDPEIYVNQTFDFVVNRINNRNKISLEVSRIPLLKEELEKEIKLINIGDKVTVTDFQKNKGGIEFNYKNIRIFIPWKEISYIFIDENSNLDNIEGQKAEIIDIKKTKYGYNVVASIKKCLEDPFENFIKTNEENQEIIGKVIRTEFYGIFIEFESGLRGLLHRNDATDEIIKNAKLNDVLTTKIKEINKEKKQINLKI